MDTLFFIASKFIGALLRPDTWIIIALFVIVLALKKKQLRLAIWVANVMLVALLALAILPLGNIVLQPIERKFPINPPLIKVDGIIVLGGGASLRTSVYWGQMQLNEGGDRFTESLALAKRFPEAKLLFTGGSGALRDLGNEDFSEASIAKQFFLKQGIAPERLLFENQSRNTAENARFSLKLANPEHDETWVLVTSAFHMPRSIRSFETAGWSGLVAWPVDYRTSRFVDGVGWQLTGHLKVLTIAIRELIGKLVYQMTNR